MRRSQNENGNSKQKKRSLSRYFFRFLKRSNFFFIHYDVSWSTAVLDSDIGRPGGGEDATPKLWVRECRLRSQFRRNTFPHEAQWYGLMSVWVNRWVLRLLRWLKLRAQTGHLCGDSSMWRILWTARVRLWQKPLPHSAHLNGFSLLWIYLKIKNKKIYLC